MAGKGQIKPIELYEAVRIGGCLVHSRLKGLARKLWQQRHKTTLVSKVFVCHTCDNPQCINDEHHFLGSAGDNARDMCAKGRHVGARGKACHTTPHSKLAKRRMSKAHKALWLDEEYAAKQEVVRASEDFKAKMGKPRPAQSEAMKNLWDDKKFQSKMAKARKSSDYVTPALEVWDRPGYHERMKAIQQSPEHRALMSKVSLEREARKRAERNA